MPPNRKPIADRLWPKIDIRGPDECWPWIGLTAKPFGHGLIAAPGGEPMLQAHRVVWEEVNGPIPKGLCALHTCDNPPCCNPKHLFLGTRKDNSDDMVKKGRQSRGLRHITNRKLSDADIISIYLDPRTHRAISASFAISKSQVHAIKSQSSWANLTKGLEP